MNLMLRQCTPEDVYTLKDISCETFRDAFADKNRPSELQAHLDKAYDLKKLHQELSNVHSQFYFLYADGVLAGYLKCNEAPAQTEIHDDNSLEIERIYIIQEFQGHGLGGFLINKAIEMAQMGKKHYLWLGVWEKNQKAISFYTKHGFYKIGSHPFFVGDDEQTDYIMRKDL